jgi:glycosyltransferase involved in cell wall biosynthesis
MTVSDGGVVVVHPAKQHAYETALALQKAGRLREFITGFYYKRDTFPYSLIAYLPASSRAAALEELQKRFEPALDVDLIRSWPYAEALSRTVGRISWIDYLSRGYSAYPFINWTSDWYARRAVSAMRPKPAAVYGFSGAALQLFTRARQLGIPTIYDVPNMFDTRDINRREYETLGLTRSMVPTTVARVRGELALADWVITPSETAGESVRRAGFAGRGIHVIPFGADTSVFMPAAEARPPGPIRVVFAGRLAVLKGLHYLLAAWRRAGLDAELILAGPPGEPEFVALMRQQYAGQFVEAGNLTRSALAALFASADLFVLPSLAEGSALVTYQALASGLPCIVTPEAGSVVRDGIEGFVVPSRDSGALQNRIELLCRDAVLRQRMARAALARGREFTWHRYHRELASAIEKAVH